MKHQKHTQVTYAEIVKVVFVELPPFKRLQASYLDDDAYKALQNELMLNPQAGDVIEGTGGLRKLRQPDPRRGKGKRGGLRVIYDKDQADDLTPEQRKAVKRLLETERDKRQPKEV